MALISMLVIIVTVITQGVRVPADLRGQLKGSLLVNDGFFQAIGVISFGKPSVSRFSICTDINTSICVSYVFGSNRVSTLFSIDAFQQIIIVSLFTVHSRSLPWIGLRGLRITQQGYPWLHVWQWRWQAFLLLAIKPRAMSSTTSQPITSWSTLLACKHSVHNFSESDADKS